MMHPHQLESLTTHDNLYKNLLHSMVLIVINFDSFFVEFIIDSLLREYIFH